MPQAAWPDAAAVSAYLAGINFTVPSGVTVAVYLGAAITEWERKTGYEPFLAAAPATTRRFDPPGASDVSGWWSYRGGRRVLNLKAGLVTLTSVYTHASLDDDGNELDIDEDFWLLPLNANVKSRPYTEIEFRSPLFGHAASVEVTGTWGFFSTIPDDAYLAVLQQAAGNIVRATTVGLMDGLSAWDEGDVKEKYDLDALTKRANAWQSDFDKVVARYKRLVL